MASDDGLPVGALAIIAAIIERHAVIRKAILLGSRAMGTHSPSSDIDIALEGDDLTLQVLGRLAADFDESSLPVAVDVVVAETIRSEALSAHIARYGRALWERREQLLPEIKRGNL